MLRGRQLRGNLIPLISQAKLDPGSEFTLSKTCWVFLLNDLLYYRELWKAVIANDSHPAPSAPQSPLAIRR